ncbi:MAG: hypothetical protein GY906_20930, partial [bacterium]|nr:hypothetical protein [bacterium]
SRDRWEGLVGDVLGRLVGAVDGGLFPHAVLLIGPEALGRELVAIELASALTCHEGATQSCSCRSCKRVRGGVHPDVVIVQGTGASGKINIEQVRGIVDQAPGKPFEGRHRVWILDGVEAARLGPEAANALLKTLEEPPSHVRFVLLAANPEAVLATIRSRCQTTILPGVVAAASFLGTAGLPELAGWNPEEVDVASEVEVAARALAAAYDDHQIMPLIQLARHLKAEPWAFEVLQAAALDLGSREKSGDVAEDFIRLAAELLEVQGRTSALNLNQGRQILSCLLRRIATS